MSEQQQQPPQQNSTNPNSDKIKVSAVRRLFLFVDDAANALNEYPEIELSGLGLGKQILSNLS
jgi:hypothetical protein